MNSIETSKNKVYSKYQNILGTVESAYKEFQNSEECQEKLWKEFSEKTKAEFRLTLLYDKDVKDVLIMRMRQFYHDFYFGQSFLQKLQFTELFSQLLLQKEFISKRDHSLISEEVKRYESDPCFSFTNKLVYLQKAKSQEDFRADFFMKYCNVKDEEEIEEWDEDEVIEKYRNFWRDLIFNQKPKPELVVYIHSCFSKFENVPLIFSEDGELARRVQEVIGDKMGRNQIEMEINQQLKEIAEMNSYDHSKENKAKNDREFANLKRILGRFSSMPKFKELQMEIKLSKFGSLISGFAGTDADLDVTILTNNYVNEGNMLQYLCDFLRIEFAEEDKKTGRTTKVQKIDASTPLVEVKISESRREQPFKIDVLVNNVLGVLNSRFLSVYSQIQWVKRLGILVKLWAKSREMIAKDLLSSYATILMMLHFLIKRKYVNLILDSRHRIEDSSQEKFEFKRTKKGNEERFPVYYKFISDSSRASSYKSMNLFEVFKEFVEFYSESGEHWKNGGRSIITVDGSTGKEFEEDCCFTIKDPFDKPHNPGRAKETHKSFFKSKFTQAYHQLSRVETVKKSFDRKKIIAGLFERN